VGAAAAALQLRRLRDLSDINKRWAMQPVNYCYCCCYMCRPSTLNQLTPMCAAPAGANPNCYPECTCAAYSTVGAVLAYEGARNHPELLKQYRQACVRAISNKVTASVLPVHVRKEHSRATCLLKIADWAKAESVLEKCPAMVDLMKEKGVRTQG